MSRLSVLAALAACFSLPPLLWAGPYSSGGANTTAGAPDPGIAGYVGLDGDGILSANNRLNPAFSGWATGVVSYTPAVSATLSLDSIWKNPPAALGPTSGDYADVVSLGDLTSADIAAGKQPGSIVLSFNGGIRNGSGPDFAVFENALGTNASNFAELAYVEVSSSGGAFVRFPSVSLNPNPVATYGQLDPTNVYNLVGKHLNGNGNSWGTPFDLSDVAGDPLVTSGAVNLNAIQYVRIVDIPGTGAFTDSQGHPIYDPSPTFGSGGFDLEAIGVINGVPEPSTAALGMIVVLGTLARRSRQKKFN